MLYAVMSCFPLSIRLTGECKHRDRDPESGVLNQSLVHDCARRSWFWGPRDPVSLTWREDPPATLSTLHLPSVQALDVTTRTAHGGSETPHQDFSYTARASVRVVSLKSPLIDASCWRDKNKWLLQIKLSEICYRDRAKFTELLKHDKGTKPPPFPESPSCDIQLNTAPDFKTSRCMT